MRNVQQLIRKLGEKIEIIFSHSGRPCADINFANEESRDQLIANQLHRMSKMYTIRNITFSALENVEYR